MCRLEAEKSKWDSAATDDEREEAATATTTATVRPEVDHSKIKKEN